MKSRWRTVTSRMGVAAAVAVGVLAAAPGEARASSSEDALLLLAGVATLGCLGGDIAFASHDLDAAKGNKLPRDGWLIAEVAVGAPQTILFNGMMLGFNTSRDETMADIVTAIGVIPTAGVTALTTHGIWGLADAKTDADALAGISVITGTNFAFTMAALGRASQRSFHSRGIGIFEVALTAPGAAVGIYESTIDRPQRGAWIALTAWSSALVVHGVVSAIVDGEVSSPDPAPDPVPEPSLKRAAQRGFGPATFTMAPTFLSDGSAAQIPGIVAVGTF